MEKLEFRHKELEVLVKKGEIWVQNPKKLLFTSLHSRYLPTYKNGIIDASKFMYEPPEDDADIFYQNNYKRYLGFRNIHLGTLNIAGFLNPRYDLTLAYELQEVLDQPHLIVDYDSFMNVMLIGMNAYVKDLFQEKYNKNCEVLVRELDIDKAMFSLAYSKEAKETLKNISRKVKVHDIAQLRQDMIDLYGKCVLEEFYE